jgi:general secretion pathway protein A
VDQSLKPDLLMIMYKAFFGLRENPFAVNPDPHFLVPTHEVEEAISSLIYCIQQRRGFILLTGEVGTGKTTLLNLFLDWLREAGVASAFIFNPRLDPIEFFDFMMTDFGIPCESSLKSQKLIRLNHWLLERYRAKQTAVLVIDEAQNLSTEVLEEIRLLTNLETAREKLLQIVLAGQPELEDKLSRPELRQLRQRITLRCKTRPFDGKETEAYINERLRISGRNGRPIFTSKAVERIYYYSGGIPRVINLICDHALIIAYAEERQSVSPAIIDAVGMDFDLGRRQGSSAPAPANGDGTQARGDSVPMDLPALVEPLGRLDVDKKCSR